MQTYPNELRDNLRNKGFTIHEIEALTEYWRGWWAVLFITSAAEIRAASRDCLR